MKADSGFDAVIEFPAMHIGFRVDAGRIQEICFLPRSVPLRAAKDKLAARAVRQFRKYLEDPGARFDLPLAEKGSAFQRRVWNTIRTIPRGRTLSYGQVAKHIRSAPRSVGQACGANWFPLVVPCHRVVASNGIGGFGNHGEGFHIEIKRWLLQHECCPCVHEGAKV
jgi:methylated-DNA-[protein]-cysteine S-methyltransferase